MSQTSDMLNFLENHSEEEKLHQIKKNYQLTSERNARAILHILENSQDADKYELKIEKTIRKLEDKLDKEHKRLQKKAESFTFNGIIDRTKEQELNGDILELKKLLS